MAKTDPPSGQVAPFTPKTARKSRKSPEPVQVKEFVKNITRVRERLINFLLWNYSFVLAATLLIFFLEGFKVMNFHLDISILNKLAVSVIGEIGGLLTLTFAAVFRQR